MFTVGMVKEKNEIDKFHVLRVWSCWFIVIVMFIISCLMLDALWRLGTSSLLTGWGRKFQLNPEGELEVKKRGKSLREFSI